MWMFTDRDEYTFRHPLIRAVAYESQLRSDRAQLHRRLAEAIAARDAISVDKYAALIAEHLEAAGDWHAAYDWHMRAGAWSSVRDTGAARLSWERARRIAEAIPGAIRSDGVAHRAKNDVVESTWRVGGDIADTRIRRTSQAVEGVGDNLSLAVAMYGQILVWPFNIGTTKRRCWRPNSSTYCRTARTR